VSTQLDWVVGLGKEQTYGSPVAPTRFFETEAKMGYNITRAQGSGVRPGKALPRLARNAVTRREVSGDFEVDVTTRGFGFLLEAVFGSCVRVDWVDPDMTVGTNLFKSVLAKTDPLPSYTIYEVVPRLLETGVQPGHLFAGCVADSLTLDLKEGGFLTAKISWVGRGFSLQATQTAAVYPANDQLIGFVGARVFSGTAPAPWPEMNNTMYPGTAWPEMLNVKEFSVTIKNNVDSDGFNLGGNGQRSRRPVLGKREVTGSLTAEFDDAVVWQWYQNQDARGLLLNATPDDNGLNLYLPCVKLGGENPKSNGGGPVTITAPFEVFDNDTAEPVVAYYATFDTAP
jgi:hypothetical protein